jgi:hypothetical protein
MQQLLQRQAEDQQARERNNPSARLKEFARVNPSCSGVLHFTVIDGRYLLGDIELVPERENSATEVITPAAQEEEENNESAEGETSQSHGA